VLTGIIGSLLAQGVMAPAATWAGAYLHGLAADLVAARIGERPLRAGDLPDALPKALATVLRSTHLLGRLRTVLS
jgi:NAD(P)H-hydrate epimerase